VGAAGPVTLGYKFSGHFTNRAGNRRGFEAGGSRVSGAPALQDVVEVAQCALGFSQRLRRRGGSGCGRSALLQ